ncbi:hypothetical protein A0H76_2854 [Hepatospora eriocheir]|uniref:Uncharacterized protein n=1 Tax=Hepatospora eriocheir TaxID=1081669 RepID=A0A1X0Q5F0_9MICR|nr:hypothetical protein A0H76_2854 [Hepatospora eriocheir]
MDEEIIPRELEETIEFEDLEKLINLDEIEKIMVFKTIEEFVQTEKFEEIIEFGEQTQFKTLEKPRSIQNIIQYSHITEETFNFFVEFLKKFDVSFSSVNIILDDIEEQYKEKICEVLQRSDFSFPIFMLYFHDILKIKTFNESKLEKIANLDLNVDQNDSKKLSYFEYFY